MSAAVITIATEIIPTLNQFPTIDWVKIYDEDGKTEQPDGQADSIPEQLVCTVTSGGSVLDPRRTVGLRRGRGCGLHRVLVVLVWLIVLL